MWKYNGNKFKGHIKYEINKEENKLRIFGDTFIKNNYNNCKLILNGKVNKLVSHLDIKKIKINKNRIEIKLRGIKNIIFADEMLFNCSSVNHYLIYLNGIQKI